MILIVDDDISIVKLLKTALENEGYSVETASNGVDAYDQLKSGSCKGMLLDVRMPRINGMELLLLMQKEGLKVPTIVVSGFADYPDGQLMELDNVKQVIHKPADISEIAVLVREYCGEP